MGDVYYHARGWVSSQCFSALTVSPSKRYEQYKTKYTCISTMYLHIYVLDAQHRVPDS